MNPIVRMVPAYPVLDGPLPIGAAFAPAGLVPPGLFLDVK